MHRFLLSFLALFLILASPADAWWIIESGPDGDVIRSGVVADPNDPAPSDWVHVFDLEGGDDGTTWHKPNLVTVTCDEAWAQPDLHDQQGSPTDWTMKVRVRGWDTGVAKGPADCEVKHDGLVLDTFTFEFVTSP